LPIVGNGIDGIDWSQLRHAYGSAKNIPGLLRASARGDEAAVDELDGALYHQGGSVGSAATAALPFLAALATDAQVQPRAAIVDIIAALAETANTADARFIDEGWEAAFHQEMPQLLAVLTDEDPVVRRAGAALARALPTEQAIAAILARWPQEPDRVTRWDLVLALGDLAARTANTADTADKGDTTDGADRGEAIGFLTDQLSSDDEQLALGAVHALAAAGAINPGDHLDLLLRAVAGDISGWSQSALGTPAVVSWTGRLLLGDPSAASAYQLRLTEGPADPDRRIDVARAMGELLDEWRPPAGALLPVLASWLSDPLPELRFRAAFLLGGLGAEAAPCADALARASEDGTVRPWPGRTTVGQAALWALSRIGDRRCLPGLRQQLGEYTGGIDSAVYFPRDTHLPQLPALHEQLIPLSRYSGDLLPAVRECLRQVARTGSSPGGWSWTRVAAAWGEAAIDAVPELVALLRHKSTWWWAAQALAEMGPGGSAATKALRRRAKRSRDAAWAYWRVSGDATALIAACDRDLRADAPHLAFRQAADLGPLARHHHDLFRQTAGSGSTWARVEAARACWTTAGDATTAVNTLSEIVQPLTAGTYDPVALTALRYLTALGPVAAPAVPVAEAVLASPHRYAHFGAWRIYVEDETLRTAAQELIHAAGQPDRREQGPKSPS
jgi:hypothetical protein